MGRTITILTILLLIVALSVTGIFYAGSVRDRFEEAVEQMLPLCLNGDSGSLKQELANLEECWGKKESFLSFFVRHDEIEKMNTHLTTLRACIETERYDGAYHILKQMQFMSNHIFERELPNIDNLF